ncbi:unnamed protein product [marine sediment metagenome]|uniref:Peptidase M20 dimerisation domain-containing protein n=2 Tax=marine sediment metagenome TaxID=412755 RepID=X1FSP1_9ZZZZ
MNSAKQRVEEYIDARKEEIIEFLCDFVGFKSINPGIPEKGEELEAQKWVRERFKESGLDKVDLWAV